MLYEDFLKMQKDFLPLQNVSRETFDRLNAYVEKVLVSNEQFNLIGPGEKDKIWSRHVIDSMQVFPFLQGKESVCDIGSGSGFPGVVLGILGVRNITLVESVAKKTSFLRDVSRETSLDSKVICDRAENLRHSFDFIVARAVASLDKLLLWTRAMRNKNTTYLLLKGQRYQEEIKQAEKGFKFSVDVQQSVTHSEGRILIIKDVRES